ncbi:hypothetical protein [Fluviispira multicolorata]|uniref:Uncharacterized protein n=1 Tax=Fluviispira multicolorata TaxID=2654512 RepID=A0A833N419_9BACT|nr:hypothetical protein [Fluviispira multicolorata]KAB8030949.1 hypothetical protein GCL57_08245 [Fluviispira multicolorata]
MKDDSNKNNDIIDAEFVSDSTPNNDYTETTSAQDKLNDLTVEPSIEYTSYQSYSKIGQDNQFKSFSWSFSNSSNTIKKRPSFLTIIFLIPIILLIFSIFLVFGLLAFVIFLPKLFLILKRKGISGLKMDYKLIRGLFERFKMK